MPKGVPSVTNTFEDCTHCHPSMWCSGKCLDAAYRNPPQSDHEKEDAMMYSMETDDRTNLDAWLGRAKSATALRKAGRRKAANR